MRLYRAVISRLFRAPPVRRQRLHAAAAPMAAVVVSLALAQPGLSSAGASGSRQADVPRPLVVAYPGPGWRTASPSTSITFRGRGPAALGAVQVVGSRSGLHAGRLIRSSVGLGATYRPASPFWPGEQVTVTSAVRVVGSSSTRFSFTVGTPAPGEVRLPAEDDGPDASTVAPTSGARVIACRPVRPRYHSRPGLRPEGACVGHPRED